MNIDFLVGENPYQSTQHFAKKFAEALERQGAQVRLFDISDGGFYRAFYSILNNPPDLTCSFSDITVGENQPLGQQWQIPHLSFLIDPSIYFLHQFQGEYALVTSVDREDVAFIQSYFPKVCFLPHAVERELRDEGQERIYDVVLLGTCTDYEAARLGWREKLNSKQVRILEDSAERVLSPEGVSCLKALIDLNVEEDLPLLHHELDLYIGGKDRGELIRALQGACVHIWGEGPWEKYAPQAILHPPVSFDATLDILQKTKLLLNSSPRFKHGSHERIFYGLASGALVVTGDNSYVQDHFVDQESLLTYRHGMWEEGRDKILATLLDEKRRRECVQKGMAIVKQGHTWDHRAKDLLKWLHSVFYLI